MSAPARGRVQTWAIRRASLLASTVLVATPLPGGQPAPVLMAPTVLVSPSITGSAAQVGVPLTLVPGAYAGNPTPSVAPAVWKRNGVAISGATGNTYTPVVADVGATLTVSETATNTEGSVTGTSASVGPISAAAPTDLPATNPVLTSTAGMAPAYDINFVGVFAGYTLRIQHTNVVSGGVGDYTNPTLNITHIVREEEIDAGQIDVAALSVDGYTAPTGPAYAERCRWERDDGLVGPWGEVVGTITSSVAALVGTTGPDKSTNITKNSAYAAQVSANVGVTGRQGIRFDANPVGTKFHAELVFDAGPATQEAAIGCALPWNGTDASGTGTNFNASIPSAMPGSGTGIAGFTFTMKMGSTAIGTAMNNGTTVTYTAPVAVAVGDALIVEVDTAINKVWLWFRQASTGTVTALNAGVTLTAKIPTTYRLFLRGGSQGTAGQPTVFHANVRPADFLVTPTAGFSYYA